MRHMESNDLPRNEGKRMSDDAGDDTPRCLRCNDTGILVRQGREHICPFCDENARRKIVEHRFLHGAGSLRAHENRPPLKAPPMPGTLPANGNGVDRRVPWIPTAPLAKQVETKARRFVRTVRGLLAADALGIGHKFYPCPWCGGNRGYSLGDSGDAHVRCVSCRGAIDPEVEAEIRALARAIIVKLDMADVKDAERRAMHVILDGGGA
jgi:hypothetical protein